MGVNQSREGKGGRRDTEADDDNAPIIFGKSKERKGKEKSGNKQAKDDKDLSLKESSSKEKQEEPKPALQPTVFTWSHGGRQVYITGTFNNWRTRIPMQRSNQDFHSILHLPPGEHLYKYIVDEDWSFAPDQPTATDAVGNITNVIVVHDKDEDTIVADVAEFDGKSKQVDISDLPFTQEFPPSQYPNDPPELPAHLFRSVLDQMSTYAGGDPSILPTPSHVMVDHLYSFAQRLEGVIALGLTHRYQSKFVTTVFYRPHCVPNTMSPPEELPLVDDSEIPLSPLSLVDSQPSQKSDIVTPSDEWRPKASTPKDASSLPRVTGSHDVKGFTSITEGFKSEKGFSPSPKSSEFGQQSAARKLGFDKVSGDKIEDGKSQNHGIDVEHFPDSFVSSQNPDL